MFPIGGRAPLSLREPWAAVRCEVDIIAAWPLHQMAAARTVAFVAAVEADDVAVQLTAYGPMIETFVGQARPAWDLVSPQGPIPPTTTGCYQVPTPLLLQLIEAWLDTFAPPVKPRRTRAKSG